MKRHRALFMAGSVPQAAAAMRGWLSAGHDIAAHWIGHSNLRGLVDRDARLARLAPQWSTAAITRRHGIPVREVPRLSDWSGRLDAVRAIGADVLVCAYFPFLVPTDVLAIFGARAVNLHPAPLPRYRGPAPEYAMILDRSISTDAAMSLHVMAAGFDSGDIIARQPIPFPADRDMVRFSLDTAKAARILAAAALPDYLDGSVCAQPQDERVASYARVSAAEFELDRTLDLETLRWRCDTIGSRRPLWVSGFADIKIVGFGKDRGPPTGAAARVGRLMMELDIADRRVRLLRKRPWSSAVRKLRTFAMHVADRDLT